ncbi:DUF3524 domain-containing protein [Thermodesulfobacteriota bacterium B35]
MSEFRPHILLLEPYYGGSHRAFLAGLQENTDCRFTLLTLPARKWKMRMQLAAPWLAQQIITLAGQGRRFDAMLSSTFIDGAVLRSLLCRAGIHLPLAIYFHENQFSYPGQVEDPGRNQFTAINFNTALVADRLAFNSAYNRDTFLEGVRWYLKKATDMDVRHLGAVLAEKSVVLHPGIDFSAIDRAASRCGPPGPEPVIVWNHRWEHDKDPDTFFRVLFRLADRGLAFRLIILGSISAGSRRSLPRPASGCRTVFSTAVTRTTGSATQPSSAKGTSWSPRPGTSSSASVSWRGSGPAAAHWFRTGWPTGSSSRPDTATGRAVFRPAWKSSSPPLPGCPGPRPWS